MTPDPNRIALFDGPAPGKAVTWGRELPIPSIRASLSALMAIVSLPVVVALASVSPGPTEVLTITDSIGIGWRAELETLVGASGGVNIERVPWNSRSAAFTLERLDGELRHRSPDVILWNNGLWDLRADEGKPTPPLAYANNLRAIADRLNATGAKVYFLTTTPVEPDTYSKIDPATVWEYNSIARRVMRERDIEVIPLGDWVAAHGLLRADDGVHYAPEEYQAMALLIAEHANIAVF